MNWSHYEHDSCAGGKYSAIVATYWLVDSRRRSCANRASAERHFFGPIFGTICMERDCPRLVCVFGRGNYWFVEPRTQHSLLSSTTDTAPNKSPSVSDSQFVADIRACVWRSNSFRPSQYRGIGNNSDCTVSCMCSCVRASHCCDDSNLYSTR